MQDYYYILDAHPVGPAVDGRVQVHIRLGMLRGRQRLQLLQGGQRNQLRGGVGRWLAPLPRQQAGAGVFLNCAGPTL